MIAHEERAQEFPDVGIRLGRVDVATPDPLAAAVAVEVQQAGRLRVVDEDEIGLGRRPRRR
jgi:hypothetical protein